MKKKFLLLLTMALTLLGHTQAKRHNSVGLSFGWQNFTMLDKHVSPLKYSTNSLFPKIGFFYTRQTNGSILNIKVAASKGSINPSSFGVRSYKTVWNAKDSFQYNLASPFINANIEATYLRNITSSSSGKFNYYAGGTMSETAYYGDNVSAFPWVLNVADVAPAFQLDYQPLSKHSLTFRVDLSVLGAVTRPIYSLFPKSSKDKNVTAYFKQGTHVATINKFQRVNFQVGYNYQVGRHFAAGVEYRLKWLHYSLTKDIHAV
ncbi:MAG TPA: hypothetical protein VM187_16460, partial [Niastella sp.]|nr:hypothetical protein [Niastella sp.]